MPILLDTARSGTTAELRGDNCLTIGFVNNMPDAALDATERQFIESYPGRIPRTDRSLQAVFVAGNSPAAPRRARRSRSRYRDVSELWDAHIDGLIVTGNEPRAASLRDEPYWPALTRLMEWAEHNTDSTIWSCLAAHAAVLHATGIEREPREGKAFRGVPLRRRPLAPAHRRHTVATSGSALTA